MRLRSICSRSASIGAGFTLIEVLIVLGIFALLASLGLFIGMDAYRSYSFRAERNTAVTVLRKARALAMANLDESPHGVRIEPGGYVLFEGPTYASRTASLDETVDAQPGIAILSAPSPLDIIFNQLDGGTATSTHITITDGTRLSVVTVNREGRIDW